MKRLLFSVVFLITAGAFGAGPVPAILRGGTTRTADGFYVNMQSGAFSTDYIANASLWFLLTVPQRVGKTQLAACTFKAFDADGHCTLRGTLGQRKDRSNSSD